MKRFVAILMAAAMLLTVLAGCSGSTKPADTTPAADSSTAAAETESAAPSASAITVVLSDVGNNMDPSVANAINTFTIMSHVYDNLLNCNLDFSLQPGVIASWEQPDELTYKLTVGDGFMFQNGEPLEGEDVVYSLTRLENVSQTADLYAQIDSVSAEGNVVTIVLKEANSGFIRDLVEVPVLNKSYCEEVGDAYANAPIGTGPYVMSEFVPGEKAVLTAWADYPGQKASIETITFKAIAEPSAAYIAVEAGDADFTEIDATDYARAEANDNLVFYTGDTTYTAFVAMNTQEPPFDNVNVRKAMAYAYNKEGYRKIGEAVGLSPNTIRKHIRSLEERSLLITEPTLVTTKDGKARNGNLQFTIRPIQAALQQDYNRQMQKLDEDAARRKYADFVENTG